MKLLPFLNCSRNFSKSSLYSETDFYKTFLKDLKNCQKEVIIESPYITSERMATFLPVFQGLLHKGVKIHIVTRDPSDHENEYFRYQATNEILKCSEMGINIILLKGYHHRKLAIIDREVLWEGSLNILSQVNSKEIMRRIESSSESHEMFNF